MSMANRRDVDTSLSKLSISPESPPKKNKAASNYVADSWETASISSDEEAACGNDDCGTAMPPRDAAEPPPPTPATPSFHAHSTPYGNPMQLASGSLGSPAMSPTAGRTAELPEKRPEKTTATAARMIAGALGVKAPKKGDGMRKYEAAIKDKERRRVESEKERREEAERKKREMWED